MSGPKDLWFDDGELEPARGSHRFAGSPLAPDDPGPLEARRPLFPGLLEKLAAGPSYDVIRLEQDRYFPGDTDVVFAAQAGGSETRVRLNSGDRARLLVLLLAGFRVSWDLMASAGAAGGQVGPDDLWALARVTERLQGRPGPDGSEVAARCVEEMLAQVRGDRVAPCGELFEGPAVHALQRVLKMLRPE